MKKSKIVSVKTKKIAKRTITVPKIPYSKIKGSGKNIVAKDFMKALRVANRNSQLDENLALLVRAKDDAGKWYYSIAIISINDLEDGSEINFNNSAKGIKLVVSKEK